MFTVVVHRLDGYSVLATPVRDRAVAAAVAVAEDPDAVCAVLYEHGSLVRVYYRENPKTIKVP